MFFLSSYRGWTHYNWTFWYGAQVCVYFDSVIDYIIYLRNNSLDYIV